MTVSPIFLPLAERGLPLTAFSCEASWLGFGAPPSWVFSPLDTLLGDILPSETSDSESTRRAGARIGRSLPDGVFGGTCSGGSNCPMLPSAGSLGLADSILAV